MTSSLPGEILVGKGERKVVPLDLVLTLCEALQRVSIRYCHWKSNNALDRSAVGDNDLDLLVAREDTLRFLSVLAKCGFKAANAPAEKQMPGVQDYFAYDAGADKWVHVHAHFQLVAGHDFSKNYRIPIEKAYLDSAFDEGIFKIPTAEFEFMVFVLRMTVKHSTWDAIIARDGKLKASELLELSYLQDRIDKVRLDDLVQQHLPFVGRRVFWDCVGSLNPGSSVYSRILAGHKLQVKLRAYARRGKLAELSVRFSRRLRSVLRRYSHAAPFKCRLRNGGVTIAVVGGDGAGKSTALEGLLSWLSKYFQTTSAHLGKPRWSSVTVLVRAILKLGYFAGLYGVETSVNETLLQKSPISPGYPWLLREVCRARDRYRTYIKAMRTVNNGGVVLFDRFPFEKIKLMDGPLARRFVADLAVSPNAAQALRPQPAGHLAKWLVNLEEEYYKAIAEPDLVIVLLVDPETAVQRKTDEREHDVRERSTEVWRQNWSDTNAHVIDASRSKDEVLRELKQLIWAYT